MSRLPLVPIALAAIALIAAGCGGDGEEPAPEPAAEATTEAPGPEQDAAKKAGNEGKPAGSKMQKRSGTTIKTAGSQFGPVLFDGDDQAIYLFDKEKTSESECYGQCAVEWPPVLTKGEPQAKGPVSQAKLGTTKRDDGSTQVTYNGHPLYYYFDEDPGVVACHNVPGFGGLWLALDAGGDPV